METNDIKNGFSIELEVFQKIVNEVQNLPKDSQKKILGMVLTFLEIELQAQQITSQKNNYAKQTESPFTSSSPSFSEDRSMSPKEFLFQKQPKTDVEKVACLAFYLTHYRDTPYFKTFDLSKLNTEAAQIKFSNAAVAVDNASKSGYLVPASQGQKQLSSIGEVFVSSLPDRALAKASIKNLRPKRKTKSNFKKKDQE
jgi:hypothetical protein